MNLNDLNKLLNSELTTKIKSTNIENNELSIDVKVENLYQVILFLKTDERCKFKQLIDIAAADYPDEEYRFEVWKFWYLNGKIKFEGLYKDETLILKKCWNSKGESISCDSLVISGSKKLRMFKDQ